jgi:RNA polymerase sigma-70 factor (ECF subfamily)
MEKQDGTCAFEQVVLPHLDAAHNLARWLLRDPSMAEDVVQDAAIRALKYFASYRGGDPKAWLLQIVRNVAYAFIKAQRRSAEVSLSSGTGSHDEEDGGDVDLPDPQPGPDATVEHRQNLAALDQALNALPAVLRECLVLREVELLSYKHIARITGVPIGTVMSRLSRARHALRSDASYENAEGFVPEHGAQIATL